MNTFLRYSFVVLMGFIGMNAFAEEIEIDFSAQGLTNGEDVTTKRTSSTAKNANPMNLL